jgi:glucose/arabinose dehydrogenase
MDAAKSVTATFTIRSYTLTVTTSGASTGTVTSNPVGVSCGSTCAASFTHGTNVALTPMPATGYMFSAWSGACTGSGACTVAMTSARSVTATFTARTHTLSVNTSGLGTGTVTSDPTGISCGGTCVVNFPESTTVTLTATPASGSSFGGWSGACTGADACVVLMDAAKSVTATFAPLGVEPIASGLSNPVLLTAPSSDSRLFIVEKPGRIRIMENGSLLQTPFLNLAGQVSGAFEQGLLGLAFHPSYASNGHFYVYYTALNNEIRVERYTVSATDRNVANAGSVVPVLTVPHPDEMNHNGGMLAFGADGKLYVGTGDGGGGGDPDENGQDLGVLLGKLLRIDVDAGAPYAIPPDNPFVNTAGALKEIWALGLRNPWRWAFDRTAGHLYIADVGQGAWEEVNVVTAATAGLNYGWDVMEGRHCYEPSSGCNQTGLTLPILEYSHGEGCSITGGFVYRGAAIPSLQGTYFYADYCQGWVRSFRYANGAATEQQEWGFGNLGNILSFGQDAAGELYILSANGTVYQVVPGS